jgi:hypothetical protein
LSLYLPKNADLFSFQINPYMTNPCHIELILILMAIRLCLDESTADLGATLAGREADLLVGAGLLTLEFVFAEKC